MIISASRRTDIPAFYSEWLMNRIGEAYCCVVNPFNANQVSRVSLRPRDVDAIVFWTKNAEPLIPHLVTLNGLGYRYYFQYTMNNYPPSLEPCVPDLQHRVDTFLQLSELIGRERIIWRYDPVIISKSTPEDYHREAFARIATALAGSTDQVVISLVDDYRASKGRLDRLGIGYRAAEPDSTPLGDLIRDMAAIAKNEGMAITSCAEALDLCHLGITHGKCIDDSYLRRVFGINVSANKDKSQRPECGCVMSKDIGSYDTCLHGCEYCYATRSGKAAQSNRERHNTESPTLIGWHDCPPNEPREQKSLF